MQFPPNTYISFYTLSYNLFKDTVNTTSQNISYNTDYLLYIMCNL